MTQTPTAMRVAFLNARVMTPNVHGLIYTIVNAKQRGVGLITRRQWWSVIRGGR